MKYFALRTQYDTYVRVFPDTPSTLVSTSKGVNTSCIFEFVPVSNFYYLRPFGSDFYVRVAAGGRVVCADGWEYQRTLFNLQEVNGMHALQQWQDNLRWLNFYSDGRVAADGAERSAFSMFTLEDCTELVERLQAQTNCCGIEAEEGGPLRWNESPHAWLVERAVDILRLLFKEHRDTPNLRELLAMWDVPALSQDLYEGLRDADLRRPYTETVYSSHFYDPETGKSFLNEDGRTALTECQKYAVQALGMLHSAGWSPQATRENLNAFYLLGLALHYFTDLTQPMHAANFANVIGSDWVTATILDWRHKIFEKRADTVYTDYAINPGTEEEKRALLEEVRSYVRPDLHTVIHETAVASKRVFKEDLFPMLDRITPRSRAEDFAHIFQKSFTRGQKATAAFLLSACEAKIAPPVEPRVLGSKDPSDPYDGTHAHFFTFTGVGQDVFLFYTESTGRLASLRFDARTGDFVGWQLVGPPGVGVTYDAPSAVEFNGALYLAWTDWHSVPYFSRWEGNVEPMREWARASKLSGAKTETGVSLLVYRKRLFAFLTENGSVYYSRFDPAEQVWETRKKVPGIGTKNAPAVAVFDDHILMAWTGYHDNEPLFTTRYYWRTGEWEEQRRLPEHIRSDAAPALVVAAGVLQLFWKAPGPVIATSRSTDGKNWSPAEFITEAHPKRRVTAAVVGERLFVGWEENNRIRYFFRGASGG